MTAAHGVSSPRQVATRVIALAALVLSVLVGPSAPQAQATGCPGAAASFAGQNADGQSIPFEINSPEHLQLLVMSPEYWDDTFTVTADVSMAGCTWAASIGNPDTNFTGTFLGNGHSITDLTVTVSTVFPPVVLDGDTRPAQGVAGLFGVVSSGAQIRDLHVRGTVSLSVTSGGGFASAGGIVGRAENAVITNSSFTGTVTTLSTQDHPYAGGIVGLGTDVVISDASVRAHVQATNTGRAAAGGIAGALNDSGGRITGVQDSWAFGTVFSLAGAQSSSGGIVGWAGGIRVSHSFAEVSVLAEGGSEPAGGGVVGGGFVNLENTYAIGSVTTTRMTGGLVGWSLQDNPISDALKNSYFVGTLDSGGNQALGGLVGRADYMSTTDLQAPGSMWNTEVSGVPDAAGYSEFRNGEGTLDPTVFGALGQNTAQLRTLATFGGAGWNISSGLDTPWSICPEYNSGYPFLTTFFNTSPCSSPAASSITPDTQTISGVIGETVTTTAPAVTGFTSPFFTVSPALPSGLTLNPLTGIITGTVQARVDADTTYTITAISGTLPLQRATSTITQTATPVPPPPPMAPGQISKFTESDSSDGRFHSVAVRPTDGYALAVSYANGTTQDTLYAFLLDADGDVVGEAIDFVDSGVNFEIWHQPAVAFNPGTGGWLVCYASVTGNDSTPMCQYLHPDGTAHGPAFAVAPAFTADPYNQAAITYNPTTQRFLVVSTAWTSGAVARFVDAHGLGVVGDPIDIAGPTATPLDRRGGVDLAYSPTSDTYLLTVRGRQAGQQFAPWVYHLDGDGIPTGEPVRFTSDTAVQLSNGSLAYNAADDEFMLVAMSYAGTKPLGAVRFNAATGAQVGVGPVWTEFGAPFTSPDTRYRPAIAAHASAAEFLVTLSITLASDTDSLLYYVVPLDGNGTAGPAVPVDGSSSEVVGNRPRVAFNEYTCEFVTTYQKNSTAWSYQLFGTTIPATASCATTPTITSVEPDTGSTDGGTSITIIGTGFQSGATVTIGGAAATVTSLVATRIVAVTSPRSPGAADVTITNPQLQSDTAPGAFTYVRPPTPQPMVTVSPTPAPARAVGPGQLEVTVNEERDERLSVSPDARGRALLVAARDVLVTVAGIGPGDRRLALGSDGAVGLEAGRGVRTSGRHLLGDSTVTVKLVPQQASGVAGESLVIGTFTADAQGNYAGVADLPATLAPGAAVLHIVARTPRNDVWTLRMGVQIRPQVTLTASRMRAAGPLVDRIRMTGTVSGIPEGTAVTPWIRIGTTGTFVGGAPVRVNNGGMFSSTTTVPRGSVVSVYIRYRDSESNRVRLTRIR